MKRKKFKSWVSNVVELHQARYIEGMVISFTAEKKPKYQLRELESWLHFAIQKEVQRFELNLTLHDKFVFPRAMIKGSANLISPFCHLRTLRLSYVDIMSTAVHCFLELCPNLEELCIHFSSMLANLQVVDPPSLKVFEISRCRDVRSLEISAVNLLSLTFGGEKNSLLLKKVPNLRELSIGDDLCMSFVLEPETHTRCSVQLEKLVLDFRLMNHGQRIDAPPDLPQLCSLKRLEVQVYVEAGQNIYFFNSLIKASPHLCEFKIKLCYSMYSKSMGYIRPTFPFTISKTETFVHTNLKAVEMSGYVGCRSSELLLLSLSRKCPSLEKVVIDTKTVHSDHPLLLSYSGFERRVRPFLIWDVPKPIPWHEAKTRAQRFVSSLPLPARLKFIVT